MFQEIRNQRTGIATPGGAHRQELSNTSQGKFRGETVSVSKIVDIDEAIAVERFNRAAGLGNPVDFKILQQRNVQLGERPSILSQQKIQAYTSAVGSEKNSAKLGAAYLQHLTSQTPQNDSIAKPKRDNGQNSLMQHYMGLQKLIRALRGKEDDLVAILTPLKEQPASMNELAKLLQDTGEDRKKMSALLADVPGLPENEEELFSMMKTLRFQPDELARTLRDSQHFPNPVGQQREALLEKAEQELSELEDTNGSRIHAGLNSLNAAIESGNADNFIEGYNELVESTGGFSQMLEKMLGRFKPAELIQVLPLMKKALADDLLSEPRSTDKIKLESLLSELANMHITSTLLSLVSELVTSINRLYSAPRLG
jgi:uncharacterized phage infection (PIP) family protein YhgE